jgi:hypothetical protein
VVRTFGAPFLLPPVNSDVRAHRRMVRALTILVVLVAVCYVGFVRLTHRNSTVSASAYKILFERDALRSHPEFQCRPEKNSCSKMTSCAEAFYHLEKCSVPNMDGDRDGIPCEQQWCN